MADFEITSSLITMLFELDYIEANHLESRTSLDRIWSAVNPCIEALNRMLSKRLGGSLYGCFQVEHPDGDAAYHISTVGQSMTFFDMSEIAKLPRPLMLLAYGVINNLKSFCNENEQGYSWTAELQSETDTLIRKALRENKSIDEIKALLLEYDEHENYFACIYGDVDDWDIPEYIAHLKVRDGHDQLLHFGAGWDGYVPSLFAAIRKRFPLLCASPVYKALRRVWLASKKAKLPDCLEYTDGADGLPLGLSLWINFSGDDSAANEIHETHMQGGDGYLDTFKVPYGKLEQFFEFEEARAAEHRAFVGFYDAFTVAISDSETEQL